MARSRSLACVSLAGALLLASGTALAQVYCNVTEIEAQSLANGVQVLIKADGILEGWINYEQLDWDKEEKVSQVTIRFPDARSKLDDNFIDVGIPPVSHVQVSVPQDAEQGIGLEVLIVLSERAKFERRITPDQQTMIMTFLSERTVEGRATGGEGGGVAAPGKESEIAVRCDAEGCVWVRATNADIHEVIGEVAKAAGINAAVDDKVQHKVSLRLNGLKPLAVLQGIAAGYGLALSTDGDVIMISEGVPRDMATYNRSETASFPMTYLRAQEAQSLLPTFLFSYVHENPEQNAIVVTAPSQMLEKIRSDLEQVDTPPPLIMVEVLAVELTDTSALTAGINWHYFGTSDRVGVDPRSGLVEYQIVGPEDFWDPETGALVARTRDLTVNLEGLISKGQAKIRANPRMAAVNGQEAEIFIGAQRFIKVNFLQYGQQQERIQAVPVGVKLWVTPWTGGNREITTKLHCEVSNIVEIDASTGLPLLSTRTASSTVRAMDGETIFIGGLTQEQEEVRKRKIPVLGDLPLIGSLFRHKTRSSVETELVFLVTPRILTEEGQLPDAEAENAIRDHFLQPDDFGAVHDEMVVPEGEME